MKKWIKISLKDRNKDIENASKSFTNYLYGFGPILDITRKYKISPEDRMLLDKYTANRVAGLLLLYLSKDIKRLNDIVNKYNVDAFKLDNITPEIEGYVEK